MAVISFTTTGGLTPRISRKQGINELKCAGKEARRQSLGENERAGLKRDREFGPAASRGLDDLVRRA